MTRFINMKGLLLTGITTLASLSIWAQNPIIHDRYTPDPAPYVHGDTLYLFVDHDEDVTELFSLFSLHHHLGYTP